MSRRAWRSRRPVATSGDCQQDQYIVTQYDMGSNVIRVCRPSDLQYEFRDRVRIVSDTSHA